MLEDFILILFNERAYLPSIITCHLYEGTQC